MASQSLYRKWRSQTFGDLIGQEPVVRTLKNALSNDKLAHAYLFTGPRGTGKTSTARLLAKTINCANPVAGEPCNVCQQCREITTGNSFNVLEIDAASNRGIDSIRDLREKVMMPPSTGKYKVYVLDEAHMLTTEAFNALLKTLEEPPAYAVFVMATTDVHKMPPTVLSRCQRFDFKRITTRQIVEHLIFVARQEQIQLERPAAELLARAAAGGMRDALSLLDQAIAYAGNEISLAQVQVMLGIADPLAMARLVTQVAQLDSAAVLHLLHELAEDGADLRQLNLQVGEYWRALMLAKAGADIATILDCSEDEAREILQLTSLFELEELTEFARIFAHNDLMQKNQATPQLGLELACLQSIELHRRSRQELQPPALSLQMRPTTAPAPAELRQPIAFDISAPHVAGPLPGAGDKVDEGAVETQPAPPPAEPALTLQQVRDGWEKVKKRVRGRNLKTGPRTAAYLNDYTVAAVERGGDVTVVVIQAAHPLHYKYLHENSAYSEDVEWALKLEFDVPCCIRLLPPGKAPQLPESNPAPLGPPPQGPQALEPEMSQVARQSARREPQPSSVQASPASEDAAGPVAKNPVVRENTTIEVASLSPEAIKQKAGDDPVVREVMRTFGATIVDVRLK